MTPYSETTTGGRGDWQDIGPLSWRSGLGYGRSLLMVADAEIVAFLKKTGTFNQLTLL